MTIPAGEVQRWASLFARALLGRPVAVDVDPDPAPSGRRRLAGLGDDLVVLVPPTVEVAGRGRRDLRHAVLHQIGYELFGTTGFDVAGWLGRHDDLDQLERTFEVIEDARIDALVERRFPGAAAEVRSAREAAGPRATGLPAAVGLVEGRSDLHHWTIEDVARVAVALCRSRRGPSQAAGEPDEPPSSVAGTGEADREDDLDSLLAEILGATLAVDELPPSDRAEGAVGDGDLPEESPAMAPASGRRGSGPPTDAARSGPEPGGDPAFLYDEWDVHAGTYRPGWCRVTERRLAGGEPDRIVEFRRRHAALRRQVRRQFGRLALEAWTRRGGEPDGAELDLDRIVEVVVDRRRGLVDDDRVHIRRLRGAREVAAAFLLDMSASTSAPLPSEDPDPPPPPADLDFVLYPGDPDPDDEGFAARRDRRTVLDVAKDSLALMGDALQVLGDDHAIYGFSGSGRRGVEFYVVKDLDERPSARTWARLASLRSRQYTRMGPAIRHATSKLRRHRARRRLLILVSDGHPQDVDYGPDRGDPAYGIADTAKALEEAERAGVTTFCITVDPSGDDYLREMCPDRRYLVIDDIASLPTVLPKLYRGLGAAPARWRATASQQ